MEQPNNLYAQPLLVADLLLVLEVTHNLGFTREGPNQPGKKNTSVNVVLNI